MKTRDMIESNLKYFGSVRLSNIEEEKLSLLHEGLAKKIGIPTPCADSCEEIIVSLLKMKALYKNILHTHKAIDVTTSLRHVCQGPDLSTLFINKPLLKIVSFNSLKLRVGDERLRDQWASLVCKFSEFDVILLSEVPGTCMWNSNILLCTDVHMRHTKLTKTLEHA